MKAWRISSAAVVAAVGAWILFTFPPTTSGFYPQCAFRHFTGLDCPGCGSTRALHALLHGRFGEAFAFNPFLFFIIATALFALPSVLRGERPAFLSKPWFGWGCVIVTTGWWIGRNL